MTDERDPSIPRVDEVLGADPAADTVVHDDAPRVGVMLADAVDEDRRHAAVAQHLQARALLVDRRDDDALHPLLHEQIEVLVLTVGVVGAVRDDHAEVEFAGCRVGAEHDVDEEGVREVGRGHPDRAKPARAVLPGALPRHEVEVADRVEHALASVGVDVERPIEHVAHGAGRDPGALRHVTNGDCSLSSAVAVH